MVRPKGPVTLWRICDKLVANREKITIRVPSHTITIIIRELLGFPAVTCLRRMRLRTWCRIGVLFPVRLSLEIARGDCARSQTQLAATCG